MALVPTIRTFVAGEVVLASYFNTNINGPISFLLARPIFRGRQTAAQSLTNNVFSAVTLDAEDVDSANGHSTVTNTSRYTHQYAGWYAGSGGVGFAAGATGSRAGDFRVNATTLNASQVNMNALASGTSQLGLVTELYFANVNDYIEIFAFHNQGVALNTAVSGDQQSRMNIMWESN
jgi:hypothetical protein